jgi:hypothetical protein
MVYAWSIYGLLDRLYFLCLRRWRTPNRAMITHTAPAIAIVSVVLTAATSWVDATASVRVAVIVLDSVVVCRLVLEVTTDNDVVTWVLVWVVELCGPKRSWVGQVLTSI